MTSQISTDSPGLLPCPFCGGEALRTTINRKWHSVMCRECQTRAGLVYYTDEGAEVAAWNRRISSDSALLATVTRERDSQNRQNDVLAKMVEESSAASFAAESALAATQQRYSILHMAVRDILQFQPEPTGKAVFEQIAIHARSTALQAQKDLAVLSETKAS